MSKPKLSPEFDSPEMRRATALITKLIQVPKTQVDAQVKRSRKQPDKKPKPAKT